MKIFLKHTQKKEEEYEPVCTYHPAFEGRTNISGTSVPQKSLGIPDLSQCE